MRDLISKLKHDLAMTVKPDASHRKKTQTKVPTESSSSDVAVQTDLESAEDASEKLRKENIEYVNELNRVWKRYENRGGKIKSKNERNSEEESSNYSSGSDNSSCENSSDEDDSDDEESSCEESSNEESSDDTDNDTVSSNSTDSDQSEPEKEHKHSKNIPGDTKLKNTKDSISTRDKRLPKSEKKKENSIASKKSSNRKRGYDTVRDPSQRYRRPYYPRRSDPESVRQFKGNFKGFMNGLEVKYLRGKESEETVRIIQDMIMNFVDRQRNLDMGCFTDPEEYDTDPDAAPTDSEDESNEDSSDDDNEKSPNEGSNDEVNELQEARLQLDENNKYLEKEIQLMQNQDLRLSTRLDYEQHYKFYEDLRNELIAKKFDVKYSRETTEAHDDRIWKSSYQYEDVAEWLFLANNLLNPATPHCLDAKLKESEAKVLKSEIWLGRLKEKLAMAEYRLKVLEELCKTRNHEVVLRILQIDRQIRRVGRSMWHVYDAIVSPKEKDTKNLSKFEVKRMVKIEKKRNRYVSKLLIWLEKEKDRLLDMRRNFRSKLRESDSIAVFIEQEKSQLKAQKKDLARRAANFTESRKDMEDIRADFEGYVTEYEDLDTETSDIQTLIDDLKSQPVLLHIISYPELIDRLMCKLIPLPLLANMATEDLELH
ncbi:uncharacterized protein LOC129230352 [Uloborus diversus]|uniref:uncharacterized protein LOC129230352 n=1 Tax=Uloborus diversus TaxID=327109 RepID=UPI0024091353|nr:uncharacterized protein LOC129230352 [Uloborus diversus]